MIRRWRRRMRSRIVFVPVYTHGATIVASGLAASRDRVRLIAVERWGGWFP